MKKFNYFRGVVSDELINNPPQGELYRPVLRIPIPHEPMLQNRFLVRFPERLGISEYMVKSTSRPSCTFNNGMMQWDDMTLTFYDPVSPSVAQPLFQLMNDQELNRNLEVKIEMLDPTGVVVSRWSVYGFLSEINFGDLDYEDDSVTEISLTMCVHHAILDF